VAGWLNLSSSLDDPEVIVQQKELLVIAMKHFGEDNLMVILGMESKQNHLKKYHLNYDQYTKRLYRDKLDFPKVAISNGYDFY
jgi:ribosomal 30S subunit maturation factor RimM